MFASNLDFPGEIQIRCEGGTFLVVGWRRLVPLFGRADAMSVREVVHNARGCRSTFYVDA